MAFAVLKFFRLKIKTGLALMKNDNNTKINYLIKNLNHICGAYQLHKHKAIKHG